MLRVVWMCIALVLAPAVVHADMDDMGLEDMGDMGFADMEDIGPEIPAETYLVEGSVRLEDVSDFSGTLVKLTNSELEFQTSTSVSGSFSIPEVPAGLYDLEISQAGYLTHTERLNLQAPYNVEFQLLVFAEAPVVVEVLSEFSTLEFTLEGSQTVEESLTSSNGVALWQGTLHRGLWDGSVMAEDGSSRHFQIEVGKNSEPISLRIFLDESPTPRIQTESGCGCATSSADSTWLLAPFVLLLGWVRRRWAS